MNPARRPRPDALEERLLRVDPCAGAIADARIRDLPGLLRAGDLLVVNDAATLPAALHGAGPAGEPVEVRLLRRLTDGSWQAVAFGAGDWRTPTERRPAPPRLQTGQRVHFSDGLFATVESLSDLSDRLLQLRFSLDGAPLWAALYSQGRPVQYAYLDAPLALWDVQTAYAARPWAVEMPSAGRPLRWSVLLPLLARGVRIASVTHAAGLSSTGDEALDRSLPLAESYDIPEATVRAIEEVRRRGGRVVAVGTTVVRALEGCARSHGGRLQPGPGETDFKLGPETRLLIVDGLLTGLHEPGTSHFHLLEAFVPAALLERAWAHAEKEGYLLHEFGDSSLIVCA